MKGPFFSRFADVELRPSMIEQSEQPVTEADLPELEKILAAIRARLEFVLKNYCERTDGQWDFRLKHGLSEAVRQKVSQEIHELQTDGQAVEKVIASISKRWSTR
jgi:hypothetical protein